ncbi:fibrillin-2-like [Sycon ciliatum]|uniref:fibrillin-2-like n=1 Tax=Sycon ciliatum TaxID=27933 RepID=UPI0031F6CF5A
MRVFVILVCVALNVAFCSAQYCGKQPCQKLETCDRVRGCICLSGYMKSSDLCVDINECNTNPCKQGETCRNIDGSYECICIPGYSRSTNGACENIDECRTSPPCGKAETCSDSQGSYSCTCKQGYSGASCADVDECLTGQHNCKIVRQVCHNTPGSFQCNCSLGYAGATCNDLDECATGNGCHSHANCTNIPGSYQCACNKVGFTGNGWDSCSDINECGVSSPAVSPCATNADCNNTEGSYQCNCNRGFRGNGTTCTDIDECSDTLICHDNASCTNSAGSFQCSCLSGFSGNGTACSDVDECLSGHSCDSTSQVCNNTLGSFQCSCRSGYAGVNCQDVDECVTGSDCHSQADCTNTHGSYQCACNKVGFTGNGWDSCSDINECGTSSPAVSPCATNADCNNTEGSYQCNCNRGFRGDGMNCSDIDECSASRVCHDNASCTNSAGSFKCSCLSGFSGNGTACSDVNECQSAAACSTNETCVNTIGSFQCPCIAGYAQSGTGTCQDINECLAQTQPCHHNASCTNSAGSFRCGCLAGFSGNGAVCVDIDECRSSITSPCPHNATCSNTEGAYQCACATGYSVVGAACTDVDECKLDGSCSGNASCSNTPGSYSCACNSGYSGNGKTCSDIDECRTGTDIRCQSNAACVNTAGSYICACDDGFYGNDTHCGDVDECRTPSELCRQGDGGPCMLFISCPRHSTCTNNVGSYDCSCSSGYTGNSTHCADLNECLGPRSPCHGNATCSNLLGSHRCTCDRGFSGDGASCSDLDECRLGTSRCAANANCDNTNGSYSCTCSAGYTGDGFAGCSDVDECAAPKGPEPCSLHATCRNAPVGSFTCTCDGGFTGNGTSCADVDECAAVTATSPPCNQDAECANVAGSYVCRCRTGFTGPAGGDQCANTDECSLGTHMCSDGAACTDTHGSYSCQCLVGYMGDGYSCTNVDECARQHPCGKCDPHNVIGGDGTNCTTCPACVDTVGSFSCQCPALYEWTGTGCQALDICRTKLHQCSMNATCIHRDTTPALSTQCYTCHCLSGFVGNGTVCSHLQLPVTHPQAATLRWTVLVIGIAGTVLVACIISTFLVMHVRSKSRTKAEQQPPLCAQEMRENPSDDNYDTYADVKTYMSGTSLHSNNNNNNNNNINNARYSFTGSRISLPTASGNFDPVDDATKAGKHWGPAISCTSADRNKSRKGKSNDNNANHNRADLCATSSFLSDIRSFDGPSEPVSPEGLRRHTSMKLPGQMDHMNPPSLPPLRQETTSNDNGEDVYSDYMDLPKSQAAPPPPKDKLHDRNRLRPNGVNRGSQRSNTGNASFRSVGGGSMQRGNQAAASENAHKPFALQPSIGSFNSTVFEEFENDYSMYSDVASQRSVVSHLAGSSVEDNCVLDNQPIMDDASSGDIYSEYGTATAQHTPQHSQLPSPTAHLAKLPQPAESSTVSHFVSDDLTSPRPL